MSLADDLTLTAVTAATHALAAHFPDVSTERLQQAAEAAVRAARPFVDGTEPRKLSEAERVQLVAIAEQVDGGTVAS